MMCAKMKLIIAGDRKFNDYKIVDNAIKLALTEWKLTIKDISEIISGVANGVDKLGEVWAKKHSVPINQFPAKWNNITVKNAVVKTNAWGKKYNANAGFDRNIEMAEYGTHLIAVQPNGTTTGTQSMIRLAKKKKLTIYEYERLDSSYECVF